MISKLISQTKCTVTKHRLQENRGNPKRFWRQINLDILGEENTEGLQVIKDNMWNCLIGIEAADYINIIYTGMGKEIDQTYHIGNGLRGSTNMEKIEQECGFKFIELLEIHQLVKGIDVSKSSGDDGISSKILKDCFKIVNIVRLWVKAHST